MHQQRHLTLTVKIFSNCCLFLSRPKSRSRHWHKRVRVKNPSRYFYKVHYSFTIVLPHNLCTARNKSPTQRNYGMLFTLNDVIHQALLSMLPDRRSALCLAVVSHGVRWVSWGVCKPIFPCGNKHTESKIHCGRLTTDTASFGLFFMKRDLNPKTLTSRLSP